MKKTFSLIALVVIVIVSCKKDKDNNTTPTPEVYSISSSDLGGAGDQYRIAIHTVNVGDNSYLLGAATTDQVWDYDSIPYTPTVDTTTFLNPSTHPDYSLFPTSNLLIKEGTDSYLFLNKTTQLVDLVGISMSFNGTPIKDTLGNPWSVLKFPMQYGSSYIDSGSVSIDALLDLGSGPAPARLKVKYKVSSNFNASGTVKTPTGTYQCIRDKRIEYQDINLYAIVLGQEVLAFSEKDTTYKYNYWSKSKKWNVIEIETDKNDVVKSIGYLLE